MVLIYTTCNLSIKSNPVNEENIVKDRFIGMAHVYNFLNINNHRIPDHNVKIII